MSESTNPKLDTQHEDCKKMYHYCLHNHPQVYCNIPYTQKKQFEKSIIKMAKRGF